MKKIFFLFVLCSLAFGQSERITSYMFTDHRDGQQYPIVKIGSHLWMAKNLNYKSGKSWCYGNDASRCEKYGRLYDWKTAMSSCPRGWHLPSSREWKDLIEAAGGGLAGKKLKSNSNWNGVDTFGFSAMPGGEYYDGSFYDVGKIGRWWTATEHSDSKAYGRDMVSETDNVLDLSFDKTTRGFSVVCVQD